MKAQSFLQVLSRILIGVGLGGILVTLSFGCIALVGYLSVNETEINNVIRVIGIALFGTLTIPSVVVLATGFLGAGIIDYLPMHLINDDTGIYKFFNGIIVCAYIFWITFFVFLSCKYKWKIKTLMKIFARFNSND